MTLRALFVSGLFACAALALLSFTAAQGQDARACRVTFLAYNAREELPNQPIIRGDLMLELDVTGALRGELLAETGADADVEPAVLATVVGQHNGRAINLVFESPAIRFGEALRVPTQGEAVAYPTGLPLFATGTGIAEICLCTGMWGGSYVTADPITGGQWFAVAP